MKPKGPGSSFRPGWIQALRQQPVEAVSVQLSVWLSSALAVPGVPPPWGGLYEDNVGGRQAGSPS